MDIREIQVRQEWAAIAGLLTGSQPFSRFYQAERHKIDFPIGWIADPALAPGINALLSVSVHPEHGIAGAVHMRQIPNGTSAQAIPVADALLTAHELLHGVLHREGYPTVWRLDGPPNTIDAALSSLLTDRLIDARLATYGFDVRSHFERHIADRRALLSEIPHEPTSPADRLLWTVNHVALLLEAQSAGSPFDDFLVWFAARYPKIDREARRWAKQVRAIGYQKPNQHRQILARLCREYGLSDCRVMNLSEVVTYARRKGREVMLQTGDGATWSAEAQITAFHQAAGQGGMSALVLSQTTAGLGYTEAYTATGSPGLSDAASRLYKTVDHAANWTQVTTPAGFDPEDFTYGGLHVPRQNGNIIYLSGRDYTQSTPAQELVLRDNGDGTYTDITPVLGGAKFIGHLPRSIDSYVGNRLRMVFAADNVVGASLTFRVFTSEDGGTTWTDRGAGNSYSFAAIAGDNPNVLYFGGLNGAVGYSSNFGATIDNRTGNLSTSATVRGMVGG